MTNWEQQKTRNRAITAHDIIVYRVTEERGGLPIPDEARRSRAVKRRYNLRARGRYLQLQNDGQLPDFRHTISAAERIALSAQTHDEAAEQIADAIHNILTMPNT